MLERISQWLNQRRTAHARRLTIADSLWQNAEASLPFLAHLTAQDRTRLRELARQLIAEKQWTGAQGLELTADIQLSIALQACLPVLNLGIDEYTGWLGIVIYPGDFIIPRSMMDDAGIVHEFDDEVLGEAWEGGPVLLSWFAPGHDPVNESGRINVVIHEFAHKLDMANGQADGLPRLHTNMSRRDWQNVMQEAFDDLNRRLDSEEVTTLDPYAAEAPAEFFAVASEVFFTSPHKLLGEYPAVYQQLALYFRQDPAAVITSTPCASDQMSQNGNSSLL